MAPDAGPGLIFVTLPIAFAQVPGGSLVALLFFLFLAMAALSSTISILEPVVEYVEQRGGWGRAACTIVMGAAVWALGIGSALAFNVASDVTLFGKNLFDLSDFVASNVLLPLGGLLVAVYAGRVLSRESLADELGIGRSRLFTLWRFLLRYVSPIGVAAVLLHNL